MDPLERDKTTDFQKIFSRPPEPSSRHLGGASHTLRNTGLEKSYLAEAMDERNNMMMTFVKGSPNIVRLEIRSRHVSRKTYRLYKTANPDGPDGIDGYCCECPDGLQRVCSRVASAKKRSE